jgi:hypothetical protein
MNILNIIPASRRRGDPDAADYFARIVSAGSTISVNNQAAVNAFIVGCKADGIWAAIKASCFLAGPDDLTGALVPLVGTAPTNGGGNFVSGDYNRTTGLVGDGSTKYLDSNRNNNADPQDNNHNAAYVTEFNGNNYSFMGAADPFNEAGANSMARNSSNEFFARSRTSTASTFSSTFSTGFVGISRGAAVSYVARNNGANATFTVTSSTPSNRNVFVFGRAAAALAPPRLAFYSIGESIDLAALDARLATYMASIT